MLSAARSKAELLQHKTKLANSYSELLNEFSATDLRHVGNYTIGKLIGKGSFGKVYLARHNLTNSRVVLKATKREDANLAREIHHHRQFVHPHIARLYEVIVTESLVWLVLEYCPGDELYNYLLRKGSLPVETVQKIFTQLVGAVAYIHSKSCVHRDLKLENVLLDKHENVKLCDFGFTREYDGSSNYLQTFCGTVCYSAPEMLRGEKYAGEKVDVWSLGIILFALLKGELPFDEDDDQATKAKILKEDLVFPESFPEGAKTLISKLLAKRPLHRPSLADILADPFLTEHAPQQQAVLKLSQPAQFSTPLEKVTLERMKSAGVDIDKVIENVLSQRCDSLAGWWTLLMEKEQRKEAKRDKRRKEREAEIKLIRRLSAASSRLDKLNLLEDVPENGQGKIDAATMLRHRSLSRGRSSQRRSTPQILVTDLPKLPEGAAIDTPLDTTPPTPIDKDSIRERSRSGSRPPLPPKERDRKRRSTLNMVTNNSELLGPPNGVVKKRKSRRNTQFLRPLSQLKNWFLESAKIGKSPRKDRFTSSPGAESKNDMRGDAAPSENKANGHTRDVSGTSAATGSSYGPLLTPIQSNAPMRLETGRLESTRVRPRTSISPITPRSSYRHNSVGLRGRKSTSSSVSSVRSIHHHSKASSISSNDTINTPNHATARSPQSSVKVLPASPVTNSFPSTPGRFIRTDLHEGTRSSSPSGNVLFARRKKTVFKGPSITPIFHGVVPAAQGSPAVRPRESSASHINLGLRDIPSRTKMPSKQRKSQIIEEEDEEEEQDIAEEIEEIEEVEAFEPVDLRRGERVHSIVIWDDPLESSGSPTATDLMTDETDPKGIEMKSST